MKTLKKLTITGIILLAFIFNICVMIDQVGWVRAQSSNFSVQTDAIYTFQEYSQNNGNLSLLNNSFQVPIPTPRWNLTSFEFNFSDINLEREIVIIEDNRTVGFSIISSSQPALGVHINVTESIELFSVYLYCFISGSTKISDAKVQIKENGVGGRPNGPILRSTALNISTTPNWYKQEFSESVKLEEGVYSVVINCTGLSFNEDLNIYWFLNDKTPDDPTLQISQYKNLLGGIWTTPSPGAYLYKITQKRNQTYFPEDIDMKIHLGGINYSIYNRGQKGNGYINQTYQLYDPERPFIHFTISNNISVTLAYNLTYSIELTSLFLSSAELTIEAFSDNIWSLSPQISRISDNYSVKFIYPTNWQINSILRDGFDVTSNVTINSTLSYVIIPNKTIIKDSDWQIMAHSPQMSFTLNVPKTSFEPNQEIKASLTLPSISGNATFVLIDALGFEEYRETQEIISSEHIFSYVLSANPNEGIYQGYFYWYNQTHAAVKLQEFAVNIDYLPLIVTIVSILLLMGSISAFGTYKLVKRQKRLKKERREKIYNKYMDILNLQYILIINKESGLNIYDQIFLGKDIDPTLISGFLEALRSFGLELTSYEGNSQTVKLEYQDSKILMAEFRSFRLILIMSENPSQDFLDSIRELSYDIETTYGPLLKNFNGDISQFKGIRDLIDKHLQTKLIYPLTINKNINIEKLNSKEQRIIEKARNTMKKRFNDYFYVSQLFSHKEGFEIDLAEMILDLIEKKVFHPKTNA
jgi:hypothetical protein